MGFSGTLSRLQTKHCPHKHTDAEVSEVDAALIKAVQVWPVNPNLTVCLLCPQHAGFNTVSSPRGEVYDVPNQARRASAFTVSSWKYTQQKERNEKLFVDVLELGNVWYVHWFLWCSVFRHQQHQEIRLENTHWFRLQSWDRDLTLPRISGVTVRETLM